MFIWLWSMLSRLVYTPSFLKNGGLGKRGWLCGRGEGAFEGI